MDAMPDGGNGHSGQHQAVTDLVADEVLRRVNAQNATVVQALHGWAAFFKMLAAVLAVVVPLLGGVWWLLGLQIAAAETRMELKVTKTLPECVRREILAAGLATAANQARQEQHLFEIDRRLHELEQTSKELLKRTHR